jgi:crotonobetainyl-CoA:carnitine CoA-transferase CaiB-like acyl-CoA transferase
VVQQGFAKQMTASAQNTGPLKGIRVFDMTRILAGPSATQALGDFGADIIKIEKPTEGDDTRKWGPPYVQNSSGADTTESAYYLSANRNKKSLTLDFTKPEGLALAKKLLATCDVLFENYKPGTLDKYGLGYEQLKKEFPKLIYCSLTGFGHTGPCREQPGYDYMIQGIGGIMSLTGPQDGAPHKIGVAYTDLMAGLYAMNAILAALYAREKSGEGQFIDIGLMDCQVASLSNAGQYYLTSGKVTPRMGNGHPTIVPYETFMTADGYLVLAVGNDRQFADFCKAAGEALHEDARFTKNSDRVKNRSTLVPMIAKIMAQHPRSWWVEKLEKLGVPCGPVNDIAQVFAHRQVKARDMVTEMQHAAAPVKLIASPVKFSKTPVSYRHAPPTLGADTDSILNELAISPADIKTLRSTGVI